MNDSGKALHLLSQAEREWVESGDNDVVGVRYMKRLQRLHLGGELKGEPLA